LRSLIQHRDRWPVRLTHQWAGAGAPLLGRGRGLADAIRRHSSAQRRQACAQSRQCCIECFSHSSAQASHAWAQSSHIAPARSLPRDMSATLVRHTSAQSRSSAIHRTRLRTSCSARQAEAQWSHAIAQSLHASMQLFMASW